MFGDETADMSERIDLEPAGDTLLAIVARIEDRDLGRPTPCDGRTVGEMLEHLVLVTRMLGDAAEKRTGPLTEMKVHGPHWPDLEPGWRPALQEQIPSLVRAWRDESAWEGTTQAGALDIPGAVAGRITLDELVLHGWDLAKATEQDYSIDFVDEDILAASREFLRDVEASEPSAEPDDDLSVFDRMVRLSGRDPRWSAR